MYCLVLYGPASIVGILTTQWLFHLNSPSTLVPNPSASLEHRNFVGVTLLTSLAATLLQFLGLGSAYLLDLTGSWFTLVLIINEYLLPRASVPGERSIHLATYFVASFLPTAIGTEV